MNERGAEKLFKAIGEIDEKFVSEAERPYIKPLFNTKKLGIIAASLLAVVALGVGIRVALGGGALDKNGVGGDMVGSSPEASAPNEDGGDGSVKAQILRSDTASVTLLDTSATTLTFKLIIYEDQATPTEVTLYFTDKDGNKYAATAGEVPEGFTALTAPKIKINGEEAEMPTAKGLYDLTVDFSDISNGDYGAPYAAVFLGFEGSFTVEDN